MTRTIAVVSLLLLCLPRTVGAQVSLTGYIGPASDLMLMDDIGPSTCVVEPWIESYGSEWSFGADVVVFPTSHYGLVVGVDSGSCTLPSSVPTQE